MSDSVKKYFEENDWGDWNLSTCDCIQDEIEKQKQKVREINVKNFTNVN